MKRSLLIVVAVFCIQSLQAQVVQWATEVIEFSSELTPIQYSAKQILGKPNVLPAGGENPGAWTPESADNKEFIKIGYANPIKIRQIAIAESYSPSALFKVYVYDEAGKEYLINAFSPRSIPLKSRIINIVVKETPYKVAAVKLEFDGAAVPEYYSVDAVAISDSDIPIVADIDIPEFINPDIHKERLSANVNSQYKEYNPLLSPDGKTLYFSRKNHPDNVGGIEDSEDIWYSELDSAGNWKLAKNIGTTLNNDGPNFISSVTPDGKSALLLLGNKYLDNGDMVAGISISSNENGTWSKPTPLSIENDYNFSKQADFFLGQNRKVLLSSVMREDTQGGRDLYVSFSDDGIVWTEPLNISDKVNTAGEETSPFLAADNETLYFSSDGYSGFGLRDIYMTKRLDDTWTNWSIPENLGPTINSQYEDLYFNVPGNSEFAYYSQGVGEDDLDIFRVSLPLIKESAPIIKVKGIMADADSGAPLMSEITYSRVSDSEELGSTSSSLATGEYEFLVSSGEQYKITVAAEGYTPESTIVDLREYENVDNEYTLKPLSLKAKVKKETVVDKRDEIAGLTADKILFNINEIKLNKYYNDLIDRIVEFLKENSQFRSTVKGYTDSSGSEKYNLALSKKRAEKVAEYMKNNGVDAERINIEYFGETQPVNNDQGTEDVVKSRRVEFEIIE